MGFFDSIGDFASGALQGAAQIATSAPFKAILDQTPIAPFAGMIGSVAKGDFSGAAAAGVQFGLQSLVNATPLGDIPVLGTLASHEAANLVNGAIGLHPASASSRSPPTQIAAGAGIFATAMRMSPMGGIPAPLPPPRPSPSGIHYNYAAPPAAYSPPLPAPAPAVAAAAAPVARAPAMSANAPVASAIATASPNSVIRPYGKVFATRSAWEAFAARPDTAGGTIGFP